MASKLVGLFRTLQWSDLGKPRKSADPSPGVRATAAFTDADFSFTAGPSPLPVLDPPRKFTLNDNLEITINFKPTSFVNDWVFRRDQAFQDMVLKHVSLHNGARSPRRCTRRRSLQDSSAGCLERR